MRKGAEEAVRGSHQISGPRLGRLPCPDNGCSIRAFSPGNSLPSSRLQPPTIPVSNSSCMKTHFATLAPRPSPAVLPAMAEIKTQTVLYKDGATVLEGYVAYDDAVEGCGIPACSSSMIGLACRNTPRPARAPSSPSSATPPFAADIYGQGRPPHRPRPTCGKEAGKYKGDLPLFRRRASLALEQLPGPGRRGYEASRRPSATASAAPACWSSPAAARPIKAIVSFPRRPFPPPLPAQPGKVTLRRPCLPTALPTPL